MPCEDYKQDRVGWMETGAGTARQEYKLIINWRGEGCRTLRERHGTPGSVECR